MNAIRNELIELASPYDAVEDAALTISNYFTYRSRDAPRSDTAENMAALLDMLAATYRLVPVGAASMYDMARIIIRRLRWTHWLNVNKTAQRPDVVFGGALLTNGADYKNIILVNGIRRNLGSCGIDGATLIRNAPANILDTWGPGNEFNERSRRHIDRLPDLYGPSVELLRSSLARGCVWDITVCPYGLFLYRATKDSQLSVASLADMYKNSVKADFASLNFRDDIVEVYFFTWALIAKHSVPLQPEVFYYEDEFGEIVMGTTADNMAYLPYENQNNSLLQAFIA